MQYLVPPILRRKIIKISVRKEGIVTHKFQFNCDNLLQFCHHFSIGIVIYYNKKKHKDNET
jgi:hypothetical protein